MNTIKISFSKHNMENIFSITYTTALGNETTLDLSCYLNPIISTRPKNLTDLNNQEFVRLYGLAPISDNETKYNDFKKFIHMDENYDVYEAFKKDIKDIIRIEMPPADAKDNYHIELSFE